MLVTTTVAVSVTPAAVTVTETVVGSQTHASLPPEPDPCGCPGRVNDTVCWLVMALVSVVVDSGSSGTFCMAVGAINEALLVKALVVSSEDSQRKDFFIK